MITSAAKILGITLAIFLLLLCGIELLPAAWIGKESANEDMVLGLLGKPGEFRRPKLLENPMYITDAHGHFVAAPNPELGINADGYRSPPLDEPARGRRTILMLGDSFTWGDYAEPKSRAFPDLVRRAGYKVCNLGIGGIGARQYRSQAETYIPRIKPDAVCVMFYPGNDFEFEPPIRPGVPRFFATDYVLLDALSDMGEPIPFEEAVDELLSHYGPGWIPWLRRRALESNTVYLAEDWFRGAAEFEQHAAETLGELRAIRDLAESTGAKFFLFVLRVRPGSSGPKTDTESTCAFLQELSPIAVPEMDASCYPPPPEYHYNNEGHARVGRFIIEKLQAGGLPTLEQQRENMLPAQR